VDSEVIAKAIADYLEAQGLGTVGVDLFAAHLPSTPDTAMAVVVTGGPQADGGKGYDNPTVQVRSRSQDPALAYSQLQGVYNKLDSLSNVTMGGQRVVNCRGLQSAPVAIGRDQAGRDEYTLNFQLRVRNKTFIRE
jgi:hypothetical protein